MLPRAIAFSSRQALLNNFRVLSRKAGVPLLLPIKANAYGHGLEQIAHFAMQQPVIWGLAVSSPREALRALKGTANLDQRKPILIFTPPDPSEMQSLVGLGVHISLTSPHELGELPEQAKVHLKIDTGMNRLGVKVTDAVQVGRELAKRGMLAGIYSHFSSADDPDISHSQKQYQIFSDILLTLHKEIEESQAQVHFSNTAGVLNYGRWLSQLRPAVTLARPGLSSYGYGLPDQEAPLSPVMTLKARITSVRTVPAGETVGYSRLWTAPKDTKVAVIGIGYADGLPRNTSGKASVMLHNTSCPILGFICMDQCVIDVSEVKAEVQTGDWATVWGRSPLAPDAMQLAKWAGVATYEMLTKVGERVDRQMED